MAEENKEPEKEEIGEFYFEETPREVYVNCAFNAINSVMAIDPMLHNAAIQRRLKRIKRNAIIIFDIILDEMAQELQEPDAEDE